MNNTMENANEIKEEIKELISNFEEIKAGFDLFGSLVEKTVKAL